MKHFPVLRRLISALATLAVGLAVVAGQPSPKQVLVVSVTKGFRHDVIGTVNNLMQQLADSTGQFVVDFARTDEDLARKMTPTGLERYDAVVFNNTSGSLPLPDRQAFLDWISSGNGFVGLHASTDTLKEFPPFIDMIGAQFLTHHEQVEIEAINQDPQHAATRHFASSFRVFDEIYLFSHFHREKVHGLLTMDKHPNNGLPGDYPVAWCKAYGKGRVFYTSLGHRQDVVERGDIRAHYLGGLLWTLKLAPGGAVPQSPRLVLTDQEHRDGFRPAFNGVDLTGWKLRRPLGPASWKAQNGMLVNAIAKDEHGTDLISTATFRDFIVRYEFMVPSGANSGFYLRGRHELQILDDYQHGRPSLSGNGSFYNLAAPLKFASRKPGEWQTAEISLVGDRATVMLNGIKIHDNLRLDRPTGGELDGAVDQPGPLMLQGDHGAVAFRNLRIKILGTPPPASRLRFTE